MNEEPRALVLDTSALIAFFAANDTHHEAALRIVRAVAGAEFLIHAVTLGEFLVGPVRDGDPARSRALIADLEVREWLPTAGAGRRLAELRVETGLKMPDVCVLDAALGNDAALATFDAALAEAGRTLGLTVLDA